MFLCRNKLASAALCFLVGCSALGWGQQRQRLSYAPSTTIDQANSRAEHSAEQMVSLSADKILSILREEAGLLLQVKKALVRAAFAQGRMLDPNDLSDEAVFRLVREDENIRVIATREIEDRSYIRAKPTREELARNMPCRQPTPTSAEVLAKRQDQSSSETIKRIPTQEEAYWNEHDSDWDCYLTQYLPYGGVQSLYPQPQTSQSPSQQTSPSQYPQQQYPQQNSPQQQYQPSQPPSQSPSLDNRRQQELTQTQPSQGYFGMESDQTEMASIQPDQLPSLLNASQGGSFSGSSRNGMGMGASAGGGSGSSLPSSLGAASGLASGLSAGSMMGSSLNGGSGFPLEASRENQGRFPLPPNSFPKQPQQPILRHRPNPYADVPSLYDLYAQYSRRSPVLQRFGAEIFRNGTGNLDELPMDLPAGPDYVVGPGDGLTISLSGGISQRLQRVVDREGRVALPEVGGVEVSGRSLGDVQNLVQKVLRGQFRGVEAEVSLSRIRTVRVYVVGDVERPGPYDVSSLSTPLNALYIAGGPTSGGSLRILIHRRGQQVIEEVDTYDLLLHGVRGNVQRLEAGDTIEVPPLSGEVTVEGMVRRPALYELHGEKNLAEVLELAGGVLPSGTLRHVDVERVQSHEGRTMLRLDIPETDNDASVTQALDNFSVQDGDKIRITPILPYADRTVYLDGYVSRPGKFAYQDGMKVTDLIHSYKDLLPEPSITHAEIIRLTPPDYAPVVFAFNLGDALAGKNQDLALKPFDTVRIFSKYDFEDQPVITVTGEVRDPGDHLTNGVAHLRDAVYLAGGTTPEALLDDAQVFRQTSDGKMTVISVNLAKALDGDVKDNVELAPKDRVFIHRNLNKLDPPTVAVEGEVGRPGKYPLGKDMTAAELVRVAGGFTRGAFTQVADLTRYELEQGSKVVSEQVNVPIAKAMENEPDADVRLRDGDVLTIRQVSGWKDVGATIKVTGEVVHPGTYGIQEGERLSSIIERAGGFRSDAYPYGTIFERVQVRDMEEKNRSDLIARVQAEEGEVKFLPGMDSDQQETAKAALLQYKTTVSNLVNTAPSGRLVVHISDDVRHWTNSSTDIYARNGDEIYIPKKPNIVIVDGSVYNPTAITYKPGKSAGWYLKQAGGPTEMANKRAIFVIRADGSVVGGPGGLLNGSVQSAELRPGDMVVVPEKAYSINTKWKTTLEAAQLAYAVGIAIQVGRSF
jgi:protein involved in polysaccharide export with SLBB domain